MLASCGWPGSGQRPDENLLLRVWNVLESLGLREVTIAVFLRERWVIGCAVVAPSREFGY